MQSAALPQQGGQVDDGTIVGVFVATETEELADEAPPGDFQQAKPLLPPPDGLAVADKSRT